MLSPWVTILGNKTSLVQYNCEGIMLYTTIFTTFFTLAKLLLVLIWTQHQHTVPYDIVAHYENPSTNSV